MTRRPRVLSGIQPTADSFHLGNYLGAISRWVAFQDTHDAFYCVVDLHAITLGHDPETLRRRTLVSAAQLIAVGLDPSRCTLFVQSHVREHAELHWVLSCLTGFGEASRMTQFKDKAAKLGTGAVSVGFFNYPILQAADILLYQADAVPVGEDQRQHLELSRTLAQRFNTRFGDTFVMPEPSIVRATAKIYDLQDPTAKMSKSASAPAGIVDLLEPADSIRKKVRRAVTDTEGVVRFDEANQPGVANLLTIAGAITGTDPTALAAQYDGQGYGRLKADVADLVVDTFAPVRERTEALLADSGYLRGVLADGAEQAGAVAATTMATVRDRVGFVPARPR